MSVTKSLQMCDEILPPREQMFLEYAADSAFQHRKLMAEGARAHAGYAGLGDDSGPTKDNE